MSATKAKIIYDMEIEEGLPIHMRFETGEGEISGKDDLPADHWEHRAGVMAAQSQKQAEDELFDRLDRESHSGTEKR